MTRTSPLSVLLTSLPLDFAAAVAQAATLGFTQVDVVALEDRPNDQREALADAGVLVACAAVGRGLPKGRTLDGEDGEARRAAVEVCRRQITDAAQLGATHCYLVPGTAATAEGLARFADACTVLAGFAGQRRVRLCIEPIPHRALPTAADTLAWLRRIGHPNLGLLLDVGHCLISGEDPAAVIRDAGDLLGYIHFDDNDGIGDLHWPLLTGRLTEEMLQRTLAALADSPYSGALALELAPTNADPVGALRQGKALLERLRDGLEESSSSPH